MNLEEEMKKLREGYCLTLEKDLKRLLDLMRRYAEKNDLTENRARQQYEWMFDFSCREAEKRNMSLWVYLSTMYMIPDERHLIKPPDTLMNNKKEQEIWLKGQFLPYFYECMLNCVQFAITNEFSTDLLPLRKGGNKTVATTKPRSDAKKNRIIKKVNELIDSRKITPEVERGEIMIVVKALRYEYTYNYVQETIKLWKRNKSPKC